MDLSYDALRALAIAGVVRELRTPPRGVLAAGLEGGGARAEELFEAGAR